MKHVGAELGAVAATHHLMTGHGGPGGYHILMTLDAVGGVWRYAMELARALRPQFHRVTFLGFGPRPSGEKAGEAERLGKLIWLDEPLDWMVCDAVALSRVPDEIERVAREENVDLIHLNMPTQAAGLTTSLPVVAVSHSCPITWWHAVKKEPLPESCKWLEELNRRGMERADAVIAPSGSHAQAVAGSYGVVPKLQVVHNGLSNFMNGAEKDPVIFAAARWWDEAKNASLLDAAAANVDWPIVMAGAGEGPNGQSVAIENACHLDEVPHADLMRQLGRAAIVVSPSLYEPFGLAALEGARSGAALVLADIATYRELWNDSAIFFDPRDAQSLERALARLIEDAGLREELGQKALARSRRYTPDIQAAEMIEIYQALCGETVEMAV
ncbi:glycosyltransferase family 4 protein [Nitratireductor basaltis]|uniref:Glycosyl transferase, group 1 n=1 Tax=Nitratireductor basaltis TaxID=472175 RepID=A0A084UAT9_9HYPH|nr:glycosyltransferase family 4 protein [Nitratireductor basaltis]KFB10075.1 Glycosyl transferase, group 1 [Nitratireductor basaltis]